MKKIIRPTPEEDAAITKAAMSDPDSLPFTDEEWEQIKPRLVRGCSTKKPVTLSTPKKQVPQA